MLNKFRYRRLAKRYAKGRKMVKEKLGYDMPDFEEVANYTEEELRSLYAEINDRYLSSKDDTLCINNTRCLWGAYKGAEIVQLNGSNKLAILFRDYDEEVFREIEKEFDKFYCIPYVLYGLGERNNEL